MYTKRVAIIGYQLGSGSVRLLRERLDQLLNIPVIRVRKNSLKFQPRHTDYILNWGCSKGWEFITLDNKDGHQRVVNKLDFFKYVDAYNKVSPNHLVNIPEWTTDYNKAFEWCDQGKTVVGRQLLCSHSGKGIILFNPKEDDQFDEGLSCKLYVQYKKKKHEYRVHVFNGEVIDITQKKKRKGAEFLDTKIRNHKNGWVYAREDITEPEDLRQQAARAMYAVGLKFGAVDLIWNELENKSYVLEINTAPGLTGTTLEKYAQAIVKDLQ